MSKTTIFAAALVVIVGITLFFISSQQQSGKATNSVLESAPEEQSTEISEVSTTDREVYVAESIQLPLPASAPTENVRHSIPLEEIRQGCFRQDCIPSIDSPSFIIVNEAADLLQPDDIGIALSYKGEERFYPFPMLETHELVNDFVAGDPLLVSYCPLCGTGIVFDRELDGKATEFGVSGMLWQSNLLMYNRAPNQSERNLWSQVLGQAVVGERTGEQLTIIPSDIMRFADWAALHPSGTVLDGEPRDPYDGRYYEVAIQFAPSFDETSSPLPASEYVYGITVNGIAKAYPERLVPVGVTTDMVGDATITITNERGLVTFTNQAGELIPDIEGFWFSWSAAHPNTLVYSE